MTGRDALLQAFDRLFDAAAKKLNVVCSDEERADAKADFARRFGTALEMAKRIDVPELPADVVSAMESAIAQISPAELAGVLASIPLARQTQEMLRVLAYREAEQKLLEHFALQAEARYGGN